MSTTAEVTPVAPAEPSSVPAIVVSQLPQAIASERADLIARLLNLGPIQSAEDREACGAGLVSVRGVLDRVKGHYATIKAGIKSLATMVGGMETNDTKDLVAVDTHLSDLITTWDLAEAKRVEAENAERERVAREQAEAQAKSAAADLRAAATEAKRNGQDDVAVALREQAREVKQNPQPVTYAAVSRPKTSGGISTSFTWVAECLNVKELARAVVAGRVPVEALKANQEWLTRRATADRAGFNVPGCVAKKVPSTKRAPTRRS